MAGGIPVGDREPPRMQPTHWPTIVLVHAAAAPVPKRPREELTEQPTEELRAGSATGAEADSRHDLSLS